MNDEEEKIPKSFAEVVRLVKKFAIEEISKETQRKQLYYHTVAHAYAVERRAKLIFKTIELDQEETKKNKDLERTESLIELIAITHDTVQEFILPTQPFTARKRPFGISETATIEKLFKYINILNQKLSEMQVKNSLLFTKRDFEIIEQAIKATICKYDFKQGSVYQPLLYQSQPQISPIAKVIALADLGTLGMEGIETYFLESVLVFLEENPDLIPFLLPYSRPSPIQFLERQQQEQIRKRLLKAARLLVSFAKGREARFNREIQDFPVASQRILQKEIFKYLNLETIQIIEQNTPTAEETTLSELLDFFRFPKYIT